MVRDIVTKRDTEHLTERDKRDTTLWVSRCHGRLSRHGRFSQNTHSNDAGENNGL
ncbi:hypothetical protein [Flavobacterium sp.]|uniref:hypothetical protein n=1 Tax=Flavobacterium sp. TaxID=239 RepID=UPI0037C1352A